LFILFLLHFSRGWTVCCEHGMWMLWCCCEHGLYFVRVVLARQRQHILCRQLAQLSSSWTCRST